MKINPQPENKTYHTHVPDEILVHGQNNNASLVSLPLAATLHL